MKKFVRFRYRVSAAFVVAFLVALVAGCDQEPIHPQFQLDMVALRSNAISDEPNGGSQKDIATVLEAMFGTPDEPFVLPEMNLDIKKIRMAAGPVWSNEKGKHGLFRQHCVHCHGITGNGHGPTAPFLNPYPRDFRAAKFKFKSTERDAMPTTDDLRHTVNEGIAGTAMPSFKLYPPDEVDALVEYVKYLTLRGQMERQLVNFIVNELDPSEGDRLVSVDADGNVDFDREYIVGELLPEEVAKWEEAKDRVIRPDPQIAPSRNRTTEQIAASIAKGRELYFGTKANCYTCHGPTALGDGQTTDLDDWNKGVKEFLEKHEGVTAAELGALPVRNIHPRNLRSGVYRGGGRPLDIYRRLYAGINGTPMPQLGPSTPGGQGTISDEDIWHLVDYVLSLPYEPVSQPPRATIPQNLRVRN